MAFTFDLALTGDSLIVSEIRLFIGDKVENEGILPKGANFQDDEILSLYAKEANHQRRASAALLEAAAAQWSAHAGRYRLGPEDEESLQSAQFAAQARALRDRYGFTEETAVANAGMGWAINVMPSGKES